MDISSIVMIIVIVAAVITMGMLAYSYFKNATLEGIREDVYKLILRAEHTYLTPGSGRVKRKWVVSKARSLLPRWLQTIVSEEMLTRLIQNWFSAVKDLLDDGKYNHSIGKGDDGNGES